MIGRACNVFKIALLLQTLAVAVHNHYKRVKHEGTRRKKMAESASSQRTNRPLRQDAATTAAEIAAEASRQQGDSSSASTGDSNSDSADGAASNRVKFSGRELPDVELDKSNVLLLVSCHMSPKDVY
jgi:ATP-dependent protease Clp ATPase subunit